MDILIRITGGHLAIPRTLTIDTRSLTEGTARSCEEDALVCLDAPAGHRDPRIRDGRTFVVEMGDRSATFHEPDLPEALCSLLRVSTDVEGVSVRYGRPTKNIQGADDGRTTL